MRLAAFIKQALIASAWISVAGGVAQAVTSPETAATEAAQVRLLADVNQLAPGDAGLVALHQVLGDGWHTYWRNPGDTGEATRIEWTAPEGVVIGDTRWPAPERVPFPPFVNYGFEDESLLAHPITLSSDWPAGQPIELQAKADWLICSNICILETGVFTLMIPTGGETVADPALERVFADGAASLPGPAPGAAGVEVSSGELVLRVAAPELARDGLDQIYFFPGAYGAIEPAAEQVIERREGGLVVRAPLGRDGHSGPIDGVLRAVDRSGGLDAPVTFRISAQETVLDLGALTSGSADAATADGAAPAASGMTILGAALFAFLGGLILNLMPCVFPVLALKALSLAKHSEEGQAERLSQGLAYGAGVLVSFLIFAGVLVALKSAGAAVGWGFQLQTPLVVALLVYVLFLVGLNLSGVFEVGARFAGVGGGLTRLQGSSGSFFTGVLAAVVASPCTAPFMGAALGYALTQSAATAFVVFAALGIGFAAPIVALSASPGLARALPKPGPWMIRFRQFLAFPMYAAAAWLLWVLGNQAGMDAVFGAMLGLVLVGMAAWAMGVGAPQSVTGRRVALGLATLAVIGAVAALGPSYTERATPEGRIAAAPAKGVRYDGDRLAQLRDEGRAVFVNMTADWCISCKVNERLVFDAQSFDDGLASMNAVYMVGDWTVRDPAITAVLERFGRAGVPLYVAYPAGGGDPVVLPQILTEQIVFDALSSG
ncbi:MAG: protein-disulfide reductase DsbD domain-containing protein [Pseudomonadota bacterium]